MLSTGFTLHRLHFDLSLISIILMSNSSALFCFSPGYKARLYYSEVLTKSLSWNFFSLWNVGRRGLVLFCFVFFFISFPVYFAVVI